MTPGEGIKAFAHFLKEDDKMNIAIVVAVWVMSCVNVGLVAMVGLLASEVKRLRAVIEKGGVSRDT